MARFFQLRVRDKFVWAFVATATVASADAFVIAQVETLIKGVDHASKQSLEWVIMAIIVAFAAFAWFVISYLVKREDSRMLKEERRAEQRDAQIAASVAAQIENTNMLRDVRDTLEAFRELIEKHFTK